MGTPKPNYRPTYDPEVIKQIRQDTEQAVGWMSAALPIDCSHCKNR